MIAYVDEYGRNLDVITPERVTMYEKLLKGEDSIFIVDVVDLLCSSITLLLFLVLLLL